MPLTCSLVTNSIQTLVKLVMSSLQPAFTQMSKLSWANMQSVGDQSDYVNQIGKTIASHITLIRSLISTDHHIEEHNDAALKVPGGKNFKWFCDKFVDQFVPFFLRQIYTCKPVSEVGAEQLLLDTHSIKTILLDMHSMGLDRKIQPSSMYADFMNVSF